jgi:hypothetical protein
MDYVDHRFASIGAERLTGVCKTVAVGELRYHLGETDSQAEDRADREVRIGGSVEEYVETGAQVILRFPVTNHDGHFRQRMEHDGYVRLELPFHLPAAEHVHDIIK